MKKTTNNTNKKDVYQMVTNRIMSQLEAGQIPWRKPWTGTREGAFNRISKKSYSLLNQMLLTKSGEYATYKQWQELGGQVRKGEKSEFVTFWKMLPVTEKDASGNEIKDADGKPVIKTIPYLKYSNVFHISQVDGIEPLPQEERKPIDPIPTAEKIITNYTTGAKVKFTPRTSDRAYYSPSGDCVVVPQIGQYEKAVNYYSTAFHELTHSTGHSSRLARFGNTDAAAAFGSATYSKEELIAELGAAYICNYININSAASDTNSAAYIQGWLSALKNDKKLIVTASTAAAKAADLILSYTDFNNCPLGDNTPDTVATVDATRPYFQGKTVVFTGALLQAKRADAEKMVADLGGITKRNISKIVDLVVVGNQPQTANGISAKMEMAKKYNIKMINENKFFKLLGETEIAAQQPKKQAAEKEQKTEITTNNRCNAVKSMLTDTAATPEKIGIITNNKETYVVTPYTLLYEYGNTINAEALQQVVKERRKSETKKEKHNGNYEQAIKERLEMCVKNCSKYFDGTFTCLFIESEKTTLSELEKKSKTKFRQIDTRKVFIYRYKNGMEIGINYKYLLRAVTAVAQTASSEVTIEYPTLPTYPVRITSANGITAIVVPIKL